MNYDIAKMDHPDSLAKNKRNSAFLKKEDSKCTRSSFDSRQKIQINIRPNVYMHYNENILKNSKATVQTEQQKPPNSLRISSTA